MGWLLDSTFDFMVGIIIVNIVNEYPLKYKNCGRKTVGLMRYLSKTHFVNPHVLFGEGCFDCDFVDESQETLGLKVQVWKLEPSGNWSTFAMRTF